MQIKKTDSINNIYPSPLHTEAISKESNVPEVPYLDLYDFNPNEYNVSTHNINKEAEEYVPLTEDLRRCAQECIQFLAGIAGNQLINLGLSKLLPDVPKEIITAVNSIYTAIVEGKEFDIAALNALGITSLYALEKDNILSKTALFIQDCLKEYIGESFFSQFFSHEDNHSFVHITNALLASAFIIQFYIKNEGAPQRPILSMPTFVGNLLHRIYGYGNGLTLLAQNAIPANLTKLFNFTDSATEQKTNADSLNYYDNEIIQKRNNTQYDGENKQTYITEKKIHFDDGSSHNISNTKSHLTLLSDMQPDLRLKDEINRTCSKRSSPQKQDTQTNLASSGSKPISYLPIAGPGVLALSQNSAFYKSKTFIITASCLTGAAVLGTGIYYIWPNNTNSINSTPINSNNKEIIHTIPMGIIIHDECNLENKNQTVNFIDKNTYFKININDNSENECFNISEYFYENQNPKLSNDTLRSLQHKLTIFIKYADKEANNNPNPINNSFLQRHRGNTSNFSTKVMNIQCVYTTETSGTQTVVKTTEYNKVSTPIEIDVKCNNENCELTLTSNHHSVTPVTTQHVETTTEHIVPFSPLTEFLPIPPPLALPQNVTIDDLNNDLHQLFEETFNGTKWIQHKGLSAYPQQNISHFLLDDLDYAYSQAILVKELFQNVVNLFEKAENNKILYNNIMSSLSDAVGTHDSAVLTESFQRLKLLAEDGHIFIEVSQRNNFSNFIVISSDVETLPIKTREYRLNYGKKNLFAFGYTNQADPEKRIFLFADLFHNRKANSVYDPYEVQDVSKTIIHEIFHQTARTNDFFNSEDNAVPKDLLDALYEGLDNWDPKNNGLLFDFANQLYQHQKLEGGIDYSSLVKSLRNNDRLRANFLLNGSEYLAVLFKALNKLSNSYLSNN